MEGGCRALVEVVRAAGSGAVLRVSGLAEGGGRLWTLWGPGGKAERLASWVESNGLQRSPPRQVSVRLRPAPWEPAPAPRVRGVSVVYEVDVPALAGFAGSLGPLSPGLSRWLSRSAQLCGEDHPYKR